MNAPEPRRDQGLEVAVTRVGRPGPRGRWAAILWAGALVGLVTVAIAERRAEPGPAPAIVAVIGPHADPGPLPSVVPRPPARTHGDDGLMGGLAFDLEPGRGTALSPAEPPRHRVPGPGGVGGASRGVPRRSS